MGENLTNLLGSVTFLRYTNLSPFIILLTLSSFSGIWFLITWARNREFKSRLYVGLGLLVSHIFLFPFILVSAGTKIVTTDFNFFYVMTIPVAFFGWLLIYAGILRISPIRYAKFRNLYLILWFGFSIAIYVYLGYKLSDFSLGRIFQILPLILFYIPIQIFGIHTSHKWFHVHKMKKKESFWARVHVISLLVVFVLSFFQIGLASVCIIAYPASFWFFALFSCTSIYLIEIIKILLLVTSFSVLEKAYEDRSNTVLIKY